MDLRIFFLVCEFYEEMVMLYETLRTSEYIRFASSITEFPWWSVSHGYPGIFTPTGADFGPRGDMFGYSLLARAEYVSPPFHLPTLMHHVGATSPSDGLLFRQWPGWKPVQAENISYRVRSSQAFWSNLQALFGKGDFTSAADPNVPGENPVTHWNIRGFAEVGLGEAHLYRPQSESLWTPEETAPFWDMVSLVQDEAGTPYSFKTENHTLNHTTEPLYPRAPLKSWGSYGGYIYPAVVLEGSYDRAESGAGYVSAQAEDEHNQLCPGSIVYQHWSKWKDTPHRVNRYQEWTVALTFRWELTPTSAAEDGTILCNDLCKMVVAYKAYNTLSIDYYWDSPPGVQWGYIYPDLDFEIECPTYVAEPASLLKVIDGKIGVEKMLTYDVAKHDFTRNSDRLLRDFNRFLAPKLGDMYPAIYKSSSEATTLLMEELEANNLENLTQLNFLGDLIDQVKGFSTLCSAIKRRNVLSTIDALAHILSNAELLYDFGIAPTIKDAQELSAKGGPLIERYRDGDYFKTRTYNGKFVFDVPDSYLPPYTGVKLIARSKVRGKMNENSILASLLPIKAFGLLPTLSHMWDLIQFSFVADWFTNIGARLDDVDNSILVLALDIEYSTHSLEVIWEIDGEVLAAADVTASSYAPQLSLYSRAVMQRLPILTHSTLDFNPPSGLPKWQTVAALAYEVVRR
jgi:hypothetical protein